jgi:hypothetical protein
VSHPQSSGEAQVFFLTVVVAQYSSTVSLVQQPMSLFTCAQVSVPLEDDADVLLVDVVLLDVALVVLDAVVDDVAVVLELADVVELVDDELPVPAPPVEVVPPP